jgi:hypothetical protein
MKTTPMLVVLEQEEIFEAFLRDIAQVLGLDLQVVYPEIGID